jgi:hypothetical protein
MNGIDGRSDAAEPKTDVEAVSRLLSSCGPSFRPSFREEVSLRSRLGTSPRSSVPARRSVSPKGCCVREWRSVEAGATS